jgi:hypothetical protein
MCNRNAQSPQRGAAPEHVRIMRDTIKYGLTHSRIALKDKVALCGLYRPEKERHHRFVLVAS